jgi:tetratricopeptide (TPR) repeat protein
MLVNKREKLDYKKKQVKEFLKSGKGKILIGVCAAILVLFMGVHLWNRGNLAREGLDYCEKGDYAKAQTAFKNAISADSMNADYYVYLGMAYLGSDSYEDAQKQFKLALNLNEKDQEAYRGLGIAAYETGDYEDAIACFNQALDYAGMRISQVEYDILWYRADAEKALGDYEAASVTYSALLELEGDTALLRYFRGNVYCLLGEKEKAMEDFDAAAGKKGNGYDLFWNIYDSMNQAGWTEEAEAYLKLTEEAGYVDSSLSGSETELKKYQGMIACVCRDYEKAITLLSSADLEKDEQVQMYLALAYEMNGDDAKALSIYQAQVGASDADAAAYNRMARYLIRSKQGQQAVTCLKQGIQLFGSEDLQDLYYNMVSAYESYGAYEEAKQALQQYTSLYGEDEDSAREEAFLKERIR